MVKGTKRKIDMKKITNNNSLATTFTKRSHGLHSKAAQLCLASDAQIAILATPSSSKSNVSFFSFGHSSVEAVVSAFLSGEKLAPVSIMESKEMREDLGVCFESSVLGLGHWWDDEERFKNPQETMEAIESMKSLLKDVRALRSRPNQNPNQREAKKKKKNTSDVVLNHHGTDETLVNLSDIAEHDQIPSTSDSLCNKNDLSTEDLDEWSDMDLDQLLIDFDDEHQTEDEAEDHQISENLCSNNNNNALLPAQGNLYEWSDMDLNQLLNDFDEELPENLNEFVLVNKAAEEDQIVSISENTCSDNNDLLPVNGFVVNNTQEEDHQIVSISEQACNNDNVLLPAAGNWQVMDLDFQTIFEGLISDEEFNEFATSLLTSG